MGGSEGYVRGVVCSQGQCDLAAIVTLEMDILVGQQADQISLFGTDQGSRYVSHGTKSYSSPVVRPKGN